MATKDHARLLRPAGVGEGPAHFSIKYSGLKYMYFFWILIVFLHFEGCRILWFFFFNFENFEIYNNYIYGTLIFPSIFFWCQIGTYWIKVNFFPTLWRVKNLMVKFISAKKNSFHFFWWDTHRKLDVVPKILQVFCFWEEKKTLRLNSAPLKG